MSNHHTINFKYLTISSIYLKKAGKEVGKKKKKKTLQLVVILVPLNPWNFPSNMNMGSDGLC